MSTLDLRERQYRMAGWGCSAGLMLLLWLVLGQLAVDKPRSSPPPTETMLNWVRTIVPIPQRSLTGRRLAHERSRREMGRALRPLAEPRREKVGGRSSDLLDRLPERGGRSLGELPNLPERSGGRLPGGIGTTRGAERRPLLDEEGGGAGSGITRGTRGLDIGTAPAGGGVRGRQASAADPRGRLRGMPRQPLDPVLASFLGSQAASLPGGQLRLGGEVWQVWVEEKGGQLRVLLRQGDELRLLVLGGADLHVQGFQSGEVVRSRSGLVVQGSHAGAGEGNGLRAELLAALEEER